jgi:hypothetical protein
LNENCWHLPEFSNGPASNHIRVERRSKTRLYGWFPATVRGVDQSGEAFDTNTMIDNISAGGLYLRLRQQRVEPGTMLFVVIRLSTAPPDEVRAPLIALRGRVLRAEQKPEGERGVAVQITHTRFL